MAARITAFIIWSLVALSVAFWMLQLLKFKGDSAPRAPMALAAESDPPQGDLSRLLGSAPDIPGPVVAPTPPPAIASRFKLVGVISSGSMGEQGLALLSVDGKIMRAYRIGAVLDENLTLQAVSLRSASIGPAGGVALVTLELPMPPPKMAQSAPMPESMAPKPITPHSGIRPVMPAAPLLMPAAPLLMPAAPLLMPAAPLLMPAG